jgi:hypothetical protein
MLWLGEVLKDRTVSFEAKFSDATKSELSTSFTVEISKYNAKLQRMYATKVETTTERACVVSYQFTPSKTREMHVAALCQLEYNREIGYLVRKHLMFTQDFKKVFFQETSITIKPLSNDHIYLLSTNKIDCNQVIPLDCSILPTGDFYDHCETTLKSIDSSCGVEKVTFTLDHVPSIPCGYTNVLSFLIFLTFVLRDLSNSTCNLIKPYPIERFSQLTVAFYNSRGEVDVDELVDIGINHNQIRELKATHRTNKKKVFPQMFVKDLFGVIPYYNLTDNQYKLACEVFDLVLLNIWQNKLST